MSLITLNKNDYNIEMVKESKKSAKLHALKALVCLVVAAAFFLAAFLALPTGFLPFVFIALGSLAAGEAIHQLGLAVHQLWILRKANRGELELPPQEPTYTVLVDQR